MTLDDGEAPSILTCADDRQVFSSYGGTGDCETLVPDLRGGVTAEDNCTSAGALSITQSPVPGSHLQRRSWRRTGSDHYRNR